MGISIKVPLDPQCLKILKAELYLIFLFDWLAVSVPSGHAYSDGLHETLHNCT